MIDESRKTVASITNQVFDQVEAGLPEQEIINLATERFVSELDATTQFGENMAILLVQTVVNQNPS